MSAESARAVGGAGAGREAWSLARDLAAAAPARCALAALLLLTSGVTEAFGLLMIVPLLHVAGLVDAGVGAVPVAEAAGRLAASLGMPLNLPGVLAVFLLLAAVRAVAAWGRGALTARLRLEFADRLRNRLYAAVAGAAWSALLGRRRSDVQHALTDSVARVGGAAFQLLQLAVGGMLAAVQLAVALAVSPGVSSVAVGTGLALAAIGRPLLRRSRFLGRQLTVGGRILRGHAVDFLDGLKPAKAHGAEALHIARFRRQAAEVRERQATFATLSAATSAALRFAAAAALAALAWYAVARARLAPAELALLAVLLARVVPTALALLQRAQGFANALPAYAEVAALTDELRAAAEPEGAPGPGPALATGIEAHELGFVYPDAQAAALSDISFLVPARGIVAVTGPSGAGKTTLAELLLGLLEPTEGCLLADGVPLRAPDLRRWRRSTAYVPQDPFLLHDSVRGNLAWAHPGATEADMRQALRLASADFVGALERGLDTVVGDRGDRLSGGERQRVALAAALLRKPALLVLDEPTGQLDAANERRIVESLRRLRGRAAVVVVTHSDAVLDEADRVLALRSGRLVAAGDCGIGGDL